VRERERESERERERERERTRFQKLMSAERDLKAPAGLPFFPEPLCVFHGHKGSVVCAHA
jgi:hypothetical protein